MKKVLNYSVWHCRHAFRMQFLRWNQCNMVSGLSTSWNGLNANLFTCG